MYMVLLQTMMAIESSWTIFSHLSASAPANSAPFSEASAMELYKEGMQSFLSASKQNSKQMKQFTKFMKLRGGYEMQPCSINKDSIIPILTQEKVSEGVWTNFRVLATKIELVLDKNAPRVHFKSQFGNKTIDLEQTDVIIE